MASFPEELEVEFATSAELLDILPFSRPTKNQLQALQSCVEKKECAQNAHALLLAAALFKKLFILFTLQDAAKQCKAYMDRDPDNINFTMIALAASD